MLRILRGLAFFVFILGHVSAADVIDYQIGQTVTIEAKPGPDQVRAVVFPGCSKLAIKGTWKQDDLEVILNGNMVRMILRNPVKEGVPVGIVGDNGVYYALKVTPVERAPTPTVMVVAQRGAGATGAVATGAAPDPGQTAGGVWEHWTNAAIRLHKHIRGGRKLPQVIEETRYNKEDLKLGKRTPGEVWALSDDWKEVEYYRYTLGPVQAHYIAVTYTGREARQRFDYRKHVTDATIYIWHQQRMENRQAYNLPYAGVTLERDVEEFFIYYTRNQE